MMPDTHPPSEQAALVLGLGSSGEAAVELLLGQGRQVVALDAGSGASLEAKASALRDKGCRVVVGSRNVPEGNFDVCVVSPGIPETEACVVEMRRRGVPVISELELGWRACRSRILAVTGSNGKSTLVKLCRDALRQAGFTAVAGGNFGTPLSKLVCQNPVPDWMVVEVSSFQLETVDRFVPDVGILLNVNPNHLDRHETLERYTNIKARLFRQMDHRHVAVVPESISEGVTAAIPEKCRLVTFGLCPGASFRYEEGLILGSALDQPVSVVGTLFDNEVMGITAAACVAALTGLGISPYGVTAAAQAFERLPHRMQPVADIRGVTFVNDSKATNLAALSAGVRMASGPVRLIAGGLLKEKDLDSIKKILVNKVRGVYIIGKYSGVMASAWQDTLSCTVCADLNEAVHRAWSDAKSGEVILLSPGCASFDQFRGFEDRGEQFLKIVQDIQKGE